MSPHSQAGYTLGEMLAALAVLGLTMGGLVEGGAALSRLQRVDAAHLASVSQQRDLQTSFSNVLAHAGPFSASDKPFEGEPSAFHFPCGSGACGAELLPSGDGARLRLRTPQPIDFDLAHVSRPHFIYVGSAEAGETWPPTAGPATQQLQSIILVQDDGSQAVSLASARLWRQEPRACVFDPIRNDCRASTP